MLPTPDDAALLWRRRTSTSRMRLCCAVGTRRPARQSQPNSCGVNKQSCKRRRCDGRNSARLPTGIRRWSFLSNTCSFNPHRQDVSATLATIREQAWEGSGRQRFDGVSLRRESVSWLAVDRTKVERLRERACRLPAAARRVHGGSVPVDVVGACAQFQLTHRRRSWLLRADTGSAGWSRSLALCFRR